jgi:16S rRNA (guanine966-N2)-methyltransferase
MDRVKTALFDILRPRITGMRVLDLFAGSGSVGIEALSQGAQHCTFIDLGRKATATIEKNLKTTGFSDRAEVLQYGALEYLERTAKTFDLIYVAPPQYKDLWVRTLLILAARPELLRIPSSENDRAQDPGLAIVQIDPKEYEKRDFGELHEVRQKCYGNTLLVFFERDRLDEA